jgi:hypothetical protein
MVRLVAPPEEVMRMPAERMLELRMMTGSLVWISTAGTLGLRLC